LLVKILSIYIVSIAVRTTVESDLHLISVNFFLRNYYYLN